LEQGIRVGGGPGPSLSGLAQLEAAAAGSDHLETHHILLALLSCPNPPARALSYHGVTRELVEAAVGRVMRGGAREERHEIDPRRAASCERSSTVPPSLQAERAFLGGINEAMRLGHTVAHLGHALLGLLLVGDGIAVAALRAADVDCDSVRNTVLAEMGQASGDEQRQAEPQAPADGPSTSL
jgi:ATP-dependent Clp protease ATP-binding subunit ClpA